MKTLGKLNINSERIMKNDELVALRGGYGQPCNNHCKVTSDCYSPCQRCDWADGYPDSKICTNP
jgi:hypothetical protein